MMKFVNYNLNFKQEFAQTISSLLQPLMFTMYVFIIVNYFATGGKNFLVLTSLCMIFATFLPLIIALIWIKSRNLDYDISDKNERIIPLIFGSLSYFAGVIALFTAGAPAVVTVLMFCYFSNALLIIGITYFWKISLHAMSIAGPAAAMIYIFGYPRFLFIFPLIMVMWSRIYLNKHTPAQVVVGAITGFIFTWLQFRILLA